MRKVLAMVLVATILLFVGCGNETDKVSTISISENFYLETFYVGDQIDTSDYTVTITYESGTTKNIPLTDCMVGSFDTSTAGNKTLFVTYEGVTKEFEYVVNAIVVINATYNGGVITLYKGETPDFSAYTFTALYSNGTEESESLSLVTYSDIDLELTNEEKSLTVTYAGINFSVKYKVTYRPIVEDIYYNLVDNVGVYLGDYTIKLSGGYFYVYNNAGEVLEQKDEFSANEKDFNTYTIKKVINGSIKTIELHLIGDSIYIELA